MVRCWRPFAVLAKPTELRDAVLERYLGLADRLALYLPFVPGERDEFWKGFIKATIKYGLAGACPGWYVQ